MAKRVKFLVGGKQVPTAEVIAIRISRPTNINGEALQNALRAEVASMFSGEGKSRSTRDMAKSRSTRDMARALVVTRHDSFTYHIMYPVDTTAGATGLSADHILAGMNVIEERLLEALRVQDVLSMIDDFVPRKKKEE